MTIKHRPVHYSVTLLRVTSDGPGMAFAMHGEIGQNQEKLFRLRVTI